MGENRLDFGKRVNFDQIVYTQTKICPVDPRSIESKDIPHCVVASMLNCDIVVSKFEHQSSEYVHLWTKSLGEDMNPDYCLHQQQVKELHNCSFTRMALALNNPWWLIWHFTKKPTN